MSAQPEPPPQHAAADEASRAADQVTASPGAATTPVPDPAEVAPPMVVARSAARHTLRPLLKLWLRLRVAGVEHVPTDGPVVIASTHQSHADSLAIGVAVPRPVRFLGDERHLSMPVIGPYLPRLGMIPLRRGHGDASALDVLGVLLGRDEAVAVYPEGSRSRDGRVHRLRSGVARLAAMTGAPVVPCAVAGIYDVWPINARPRVRGGRVTVRFAAPMRAPVDHPRDRRDFTETLHATLAELAGVERSSEFSPIGGVR